MLIPIAWYSSTEQSKQNSDYSHVGVVTRVYSTSFYVEIENNVYYVMSETQQQISTGDVVSFECSFERIDESNSFALFLQSNGTEYYCSITSYTVEEEKNNYRNYLHEETINDTTYYGAFSKLMIYGYVDSTNEQLEEWITKLGVIALFVISGAQTSFLISMVSKGSKVIVRNKNIAFFIGSAFALWFVYMTFIPPPAMRAWMYSNIYFLLQNKSITRNDALAISGLVYIFLNPYVLLTVGMLLSFSITFFINLLIKARMSNGWKYILIPTTAFVVSIPLVATFNHEFNLTSIFMNIILEPIIAMLYVIVIFTLPFESIHYIFEPLMIVLYQSFYVLATNFTLIVEISFYSVYWIPILYSIMYFVLKHFDRKPSLVLVLNIILLYSLVLW